MPEIWCAVNESCSRPHVNYSVMINNELWNDWKNYAFSIIRFALLSIRASKKRRILSNFTETHWKSKSVILVFQFLDVPLIFDMMTSMIDTIFIIIQYRKENWSRHERFLSESIKLPFKSEMHDTARRWLWRVSSFPCPSTLSIFANWSLYWPIHVRYFWQLLLAFPRVLDEDADHPSLIDDFQRN